MCPKCDAIVTHVVANDRVYHCDQFAMCSDAFKAKVTGLKPRCSLHEREPKPFDTRNTPKTRNAPNRNPSQKWLESMFEAPDRNFNFRFAAESTKTIARISHWISELWQVVYWPRTAVDIAGFFLRPNSAACITVIMVWPLELLFEHLFVRVKDELRARYSC